MKPSQEEVAATISVLNAYTTKSGRRFSDVFLELGRRLEVAGIASSQLTEDELEIMPTLEMFGMVSVEGTQA